ncbi:MAG: anti-sigma factor [Chitinophagaceae bacterium]|nr:anti-sigma factor [Rubrivivax sp.]
MKIPREVSEAELQAYVDDRLPAERRSQIEAHLAERPDEMQRVESYRAHKQELRALFDPVLDEALPQRLMQAARPRTPWYAQRLAASIAIVIASATSGTSAWFARGALEADATRLAAAAPSGSMPTGGNLSGFARRAAVAHVVYSPDVRRPVEVGADQEQQLVAWLSKRLGTPIKPPSLQSIGLELIGGRLLPGDSGPVAQFMYHDGIGQRLTLYVTREVPKPAGEPETGFRFGQDGPVNVFFWVDKTFGYAISGGADRQALLTVAREVHRQLSPG